MTQKLQRVTRRRFGCSDKARLNRALTDALRASGGNCDVRREIEKEVEPVPEGGDRVEAAGLPGKTVQTPSARFKFQGKDPFERIDLSGGA